MGFFSDLAGKVLADLTSDIVDEFTGTPSKRSKPDIESPKTSTTTKNTQTNKKEWQHWQCTYCGTRQTLRLSTGKPQPGKCIKRKLKNGSFNRHVWVKYG